MSRQDQRMREKKKEGGGGTKCMRAVAPSPPPAPPRTAVMFRGSLLSEVLIGKFSTSQERVPCRPRPERPGH